MAVIQRGVHHVLKLPVKSALKAIASQHMLPCAIVFQVGSVVLCPGNEAVHGQGVSIHPVGLRYGQAIASVLCRFGIGLDQKCAAIIGDEQGAIGTELQTVLVGVNKRQVSACIPMPGATPIGSPIVRRPEVHATGINEVGVMGRDGQCQIVPGLTTDVASIHGPPQQVGAFSREHFGRPCAATIGALPDARQPLVIHISCNGVCGVRCLGSKGQGNAADAK